MDPFVSSARANPVGGSSVTVYRTHVFALAYDDAGYKTRADVPDYKTIPNRANSHPFAWALHGDEWIFVTGLGGQDENGEISDDVAAQARQALATMAALLEEANSSLAEIVWFRPLVTKREYAFEMDETLRELLPDPKPACGALVICELADPRMKIEFEAIAQRGARITT